MPSAFGIEQGGIEAFFHLGACSSTTEKDATYLIRNNFEYTKKLALFALKNSARFIYASSAATYGDGNRGFSDDEAGLCDFRPLNMYGYSKQLFDLWAWRRGILGKMVGLKYFNVFGPNEYHKGDMRSLVVKAFEQIKSTGEIGLFKSYRSEYANGEQMRDFVYVKDAADMTLHFLNHKAASGIYNVGSGMANTWNRLASAIFEALGKPTRIDFLDMPDTIREKYQYYTCADISKIRKAGYKKEITPLENSVEDYVTNYLLNGKRLGE
jgi:ADP-L-glycero-D-manno-heptose 6-epimerase